MDNFKDRKFIIFDLDGTLIDSNADILVALTYALTTVGGIPEVELDRALVDRYMGKGLHEIFAALLPTAHHHLLEEFVTTFRNYYRENCATNTAIYPGGLDLLQKLREGNKLMAIATSKFHPNAQLIANKLGLTPYFQYIQGTEPGEWRLKPDPYILNLLMEQAGFSPRDTVMIGDTDNDLLCAHRASVPVIAVTWGAWSADRLRELNPAALVENFAELATLLL